MIYITGDIHGDTKRFSQANFPEQKNLTKDDFVIVLGDFGVTVKGVEKTIVKADEKIGFSSLTHQGMPFYGG